MNKKDGTLLSRFHKSNITDLIICLNDVGK